jgi:NO-binding membrane sensor protein with MHYT domain
MGIGIAFIIAIEASLLALHLAFSRSRGIFSTCLGSIALGLAIASMHYSAMEGTRFLPKTANPDVLSDGLTSTGLALAVSLVAYSVCSLSIVLYAWIVFRTPLKPA